MPLDLEEELDSQTRRFLRGDKDALDRLRIGVLEGTQGL